MSLLSLLRESAVRPEPTPHLRTDCRRVLGKLTRPMDDAVAFRSHAVLVSTSVPPHRPLQANHVRSSLVLEFSQDALLAIIVPERLNIVGDHAKRRQSSSAAAPRARHQALAVSVRSRPRIRTRQQGCDQLPTFAPP